MAKLTVPEAAEQLELKTREVYELIDHGRLPAQRVGNRIEVDAADVAALRS